MLQVKFDFGLKFVNLLLCMYVDSQFPNNISSLV